MVLPDAPLLRVAELEARLAELERVRADLLRLATFPEQNPNQVIETDRAGNVTYLNPIAREILPDLAARGLDHPMLADLPAIIAAFEKGEVETISREVPVGKSTFEQKICYTGSGDGLVVRIYAHDITARKRAEVALQAMARRVVLAQEEERHRVARELHDETGQSLTALKISLQILMGELPPEAEGVAADLAEAVALVDTTRERIREVARGLRPPALDAVGLNLTLEDFCRTFGRHTGLGIDYRGDEALEPPPVADAASICLYRFLQEALANAARHAGATRVKVTLRRAGGDIRLQVEDDGTGFDPAAVEARAGPDAGLGLTGMRERLSLLGGRLTIASGAGGGTRLEARLPAGTP